MDEIWKNILKFNNYQISNKGNLRNIKTHKILKKRYKRGYVQYVLYFNKIPKSILSHRLVAETFIPNLENKPQVNHINGIKDDNRVENLEWCTPMENILHAVENKLHNFGEKHPLCKLSNIDVLEIRKLYYNKQKTQVELSKTYKVRQCHISRIVNNKQRQL